MDIRFTVSLILIAVGALMALLGGIAILNPGGGNLGLRLGCGGMGVVGVLMLLLGLRLRNKAVAESPALKRMLEEQGETSRTEVAKPSFLKDKDRPAPDPPPEPKPAPPAKPSRVSAIYWFIVIAFALVLMGLTLFAMDFQGALGLRVSFLVVALLLIILLPMMWMRDRRRGASGGWLDTSSDSSSSTDDNAGGGDASGDGGGGGD